MPALSVVVVVYNIPREAPRTLHSLSADYQLGIDPDDYEVIVVDNGSTPPFDRSTLEGLRGHFRVIRIENASASPAYAVNRGLAAATAPVIGVLIDGARLVTPGLLHYALLGARSHRKAVVASLGWYLGADVQGAAVEAGYDAAHEDALLASIDWPADGYRLFEIGTLDQSSFDGWVSPIAETNTLFMHREMWDRLGGMDERFDFPGGGLINLDMYRRALQVEGAHPVVLLGEGSFHQLHGGVSTNASSARQRERWNDWHSQYRQLRGVDWNWEPRKEPPTMIGRLPPAVLSRLVRSALVPVRPGEHPLGEAFDRGIWASSPVPPSPDSVTAGLVQLAHDELRRGRPGLAGSVARFARQRDPDDPELLRLLALTANHADWQADHTDRALTMARAYRLAGDAAAAAREYQRALGYQQDCADAHVGLADLRFPGEHYLVWLARLYEWIAPATALEVGVISGQSLALHRPPTIAIGVDPHPAVLHPLRTETHIFAETSDQFFANRRLKPLIGRRPLSMGFIDGLSTFEQVLRAFINMEACCARESVILMHDTLPLDEVTQRRERVTEFHTGDVWRAVWCLRQHRPDLHIFTIATPPTGLTVVTRLNPRSGYLERHYDACVREFLAVPFAKVEHDLARILNVEPAEITRVRQLLRNERPT